MALSEADRRALQDRANGLRQEITSLKIARDEHLDEASANLNDAALIAEIARLEKERDAVAVEKNTASGSVDDALRLMNKVAEVVNETTTDELIEVPPAPEPVIEPEPLIGDLDDTDKEV